MFPVLECYRMLLYIAACCCYCCKGKIWFLCEGKRTEPTPLPKCKAKTTYLQYQEFHLPDPTCFVRFLVWHTLKNHGACPTFTIIYQANTNLRPLYWSPTASCHNYEKKRIQTHNQRETTSNTVRTIRRPVYICLFFFRLALWPNKSQHFVHGATFLTTYFSFLSQKVDTHDVMKSMMWLAISCLPNKNLASKF